MDLKDYVCESKGVWYVDGWDIMTGAVITQPGEWVMFTHKKKLYKGFVTDESVGRDDDSFVMTGVEEIKK